MSRLRDYAVIALDWLLGEIPMPEGLWVGLGGFRLSEAAIKARKRLEKNRS